MAHRKGSDRLVPRILRNEYRSALLERVPGVVQRENPLPSKHRRLRPFVSVGGSEYLHRPACRDCLDLAHGRQPVISAFDHRVAFQCLYFCTI
jgi:hypothetical protein